MDTFRDHEFGGSWPAQYVGPEGAKVRVEPDALIYADDTDEADEIRAILEENGVSNMIVVESHLLRGRRELPFVVTKGGDQIIGMYGVRICFSQAS